MSLSPTVTVFLVVSASSSISSLTWEERERSGSGPRDKETQRQSGGALARISGGRYAPSDAGMRRSVLYDENM